MNQLVLNVKFQGMVTAIYADGNLNPVAKGITGFTTLERDKINKDGRCSTTAVTASIPFIRILFS
jgi:hypothetical protein